MLSHFLNKTLLVQVPVIICNLYLKNNWKKINNIVITLLTMKQQQLCLKWQVWKKIKRLITSSKTMQHQCLRDNTKIAKMHSELHNKNIIQKCNARKKN